MTFILPAPRNPAGLRAPSRSNQSTRRKPRTLRVVAPMTHRIYASASENHEPPSEDTYLLRDSSRDQRSSSQTSLLTDPEDGKAGATDPQPISEPVSPPGIVQTSADLDARVLFGEFLSTFLFVYLSVNAAALGSPLANSLNNAAVIAAIAASFMPVSGAHLNPAVTAALLVTKRVSLKRAVAFVPIQLFAAVTACMLAQSLGTPVAFGGIAAAASKTELVRSFVAELIPMFIIVAVVFQTAVATEEEGGVGGKIAALYIGLAVLACAGTFLTAVFNPARAFGPAFVAQNFAHHWVFWAGPLVGAVMAAFVSSFRSNQDKADLLQLALMPVKPELTPPCLN